MDDTLCMLQQEKTQPLSRTINVPDEMRNLCSQTLEDINGPLLILELPIWEIVTETYVPEAGIWSTSFESDASWKGVELVGWKNSGSDKTPYFAKGSDRRKLSKTERNQIEINTCGHDLIFQYYVKYENQPLTAICHICLPQQVQTKWFLEDEVELSAHAFKYLTHNALQPIEALVNAWEGSRKISTTDIVAACLLSSTRLNLNYPSNLSRQIETLLEDPKIEEHQLGAAVVKQWIADDYTPTNEDEKLVKRIMHQSTATVFSVDRIHKVVKEYGKSEL